VVRVRGMCSLLLLGFSVNMCSVKWEWGCFFINFLLFKIMCFSYFIAICEKDSISLWILKLEICRSWRTLMVVLCKVPLNLVVI
jgi:hypothetical protein